MAEASPFLLRASQAAMWVRCTAWAGMVTHKPDLSDPTVRDEGTACHWAALMVWLGHRINVGQRVRLDGMQTEVVIDDPMIEAIDDYLDEIRAWGVPARLEFTVAAPRIHASCGGTCDVWAYDPQTKTLYVGDMKYGYRYVDVYGNWQLLVYVCGLLDYLGIIDDREVTVVMAIFQPRAYRGGPWFYWRVNAAMLRAHFNTLHMAAEAALGPMQRCKTGPHCTNCNARLECDAYAEACENAFEVVSEPINNDLSAKRTDSELLRVSRAFEILEARKSALEARAEMFVRQGVPLMHHELRPGRSATIWKPGVVESLPAIEFARGIKLHKAKPLTPTQARKELGDAMVDALSDRIPGAMKLKRVDAERAARVFGQTED